MLKDTGEKNRTDVLDVKISQIRKKLENKSYNWNISSYKQSFNFIMSFLAALFKRGNIQCDDLLFKKRFFITEL